MDPLDLPSVVKCPSCGRTNGAPTRGGRFDCMFCGAPIDVGAPASAAAKPAVKPPPAQSQPPVFRPPVFTPPTAARPAPQPASRPASRPAPAPVQSSSAFASYDPGSADLISYRWFNPRAAWEAFAPGLSSAFFLIIFAVSILSRGEFAFSWYFLIFGSLILFSVLSSVYRGLARLLNTTTIRFEGGVLSAIHRPLPWQGARLDADTISRIAVEQRVTQSRRRAVYYDLVAVRSDGRKVTLIPGLNAPADGENMVRSLESRLSLRI